MIFRAVSDMVHYAPARGLWVYLERSLADGAGQEGVLGRQHLCASLSEESADRSVASCRIEDDVSLGHVADAAATTMSLPRPIDDPLDMVGIQ